jgi:hypothetical protein
MDTNAPPPAGRFRPLSAGLTLAGAALSGIIRLVPHPPNMTPVGALGLYGGARLPLAQALTLPLVVMLVTDVVLHFTVYPERPVLSGWVYASLMVNVLLGRLLTRTESPWKIGVVSLLAALQFFLITNFACWPGSPLYAQDAQGLLACYVAALPFAGNQLFADLLFTALLFGLHAVLARLAFPAERLPVRAARAAS